MRRSSNWMIPLGAITAIAAGAYILNAAPSHPTRVADQTTAVRSGSTEFPPPETSVTVTRRGEHIAQPETQSAPETVVVGSTSQVQPPASGTATSPPMAPGPKLEVRTRPQDRESVLPRRSALRKRHDRPRIPEPRLDRKDHEILQEAAPADQVERETARRTAEIRRSASGQADNGDAAAQIVGHLSDKEMRDLMEGRMTTTEVASKIRYHGSRRSLRKAIEQLRDERSGHIGGG